MALHAPASCLSVAALLATGLVVSCVSSSPSVDGAEPGCKPPTCLPDAAAGPEGGGPPDASVPDFDAGVDGGDDGTRTCAGEAGKLDPSFGASGVVVPTEQELYPVRLLAGAGRLYLGLSGGRVVRLDEDGRVEWIAALDPLLPPPLPFQRPHEIAVGALGVAADGRLVVGGRAMIFGAENRRVAAAARLLPDGGYDRTYGDGGVTLHEATHSYNQADGIVLAPGGAAFVSGTGQDNDAFLTLSRYLPNGALDPGFGPDAGGVFVDRTAPAEGVPALVRLGDGRLLRVGRAQSGPSKIKVVRYTATGALDDTFGSGGSMPVALPTLPTYHAPVAATVDAEGRIVIVGSASDTNGLYVGDIFVARLRSDGTPDPSFGGGTGMVRTDLGAGDHPAGVAVLADGRIIVAGTSINGAGSTAAILRYTTEGSIEPGGKLLTKVAPASTSTDVFAVVADPNPTCGVLFAGQIVRPDGVRPFVARYLP
jgi:uncharacterized delta-60 repeat protein